MAALSIMRSHELPGGAMLQLAGEARSEGFLFVDRLTADWEAGRNRFDEPGEAFFLAKAGSRVVGTCGLSRDPFVPDGRVGRLRRLYVSPDWRRTGLASALTVAAVVAGAGRFERIRLRTDEVGASAFYLRRGFSVVQEAEASHELQLDRQDGLRKAWPLQSLPAIGIP